MRYLLSLLLICTTSAVYAGEHKTVIGPVEEIRVQETEQSFLARIDTGATTTSIHAIDMEIADESLENKADNIGKYITFSTLNEQNEEVVMEAWISGIKQVRNAHGIETRYMIWLALEYNGEVKAVEVTLRDRSEMKYKLLIGRNWLAGDYIVDVEI